MIKIWVHRSNLESNRHENTRLPIWMLTYEDGTEKNIYGFEFTGKAVTKIDMTQPVSVWLEIEGDITIIPRKR